MLGVENKKQRETTRDGEPSVEEEDPQEAENNKTSNNGSQARRRWRLLAKALHKPPPAVSTVPADNSEEAAAVSKRRIANLGLVEITRCPERDDWYWYSVADKYLLKVRHVWPRPLSPVHLMGFNNTGNVCVWPSEEVLAYHLLVGGLLESLEGKTVLELGGGMTCLAGVFLAKYGRAARVHLTDGNPHSVENVKSILEENDLWRGVDCSVLVWGRDTEEDTRYDVVLAADCLFFDEGRKDLAKAMWRKTEDTGTALVTAPRRGATLDMFLEQAAALGFSLDLREYYDQAVWERHLQLQATCPYYNADIHYPLLIRLTKTPRDRPGIDIILDSSSGSI